MLRLTYLKYLLKKQLKISLLFEPERYFNEKVRDEVREIVLNKIKILLPCLNFGFILLIRIKSTYHIAHTLCIEM